MSLRVRTKFRPAKFLPLCVFRFACWSSSLMLAVWRWWCMHSYACKKKHLVPFLVRTSPMKTTRDSSNNRKLFLSPPAVEITNAWHPFALKSRSVCWTLDEPLVSVSPPHPSPIVINFDICCGFSIHRVLHPFLSGSFFRGFFYQARKWASAIWTVPNPARVVSSRWFFPFFFPSENFHQFLHVCCEGVVPYFAVFV